MTYEQVSFENEEISLGQAEIEQREDYDFSSFTARADAFFGNNIITPNAAMRLRALKKGLVEAHVLETPDRETAAAIDVERFLQTTQKFLDQKHDTHTFRHMHDELEQTSTTQLHSTRWILEASGIKYQIIGELRNENSPLLALLQHIVKLNQERIDAQKPHMEMNQLKLFSETVVYGFHLEKTKQLFAAYLKQERL